MEKNVHETTDIEILVDSTLNFKKTQIGFLLVALQMTMIHKRNHKTSSKHFALCNLI